jgi:predicted nucleotide-binding protein
MAMGRKVGSNRAFPTRTLEQALVVIQAIGEKGAAKAMKRLLVADAIGRTPSSSEFKILLSASRWYGLTTGTEKADLISPTDLGLKVIRPTSEEERLAVVVAACLTPELMGRVLRDFNNEKLPDAAFLKNTLQRTYDVDSDHSAELAELLILNAKYAGILRSISGSNHILIENPLPSPTVVSEEEDSDDNVVPLEASRTGVETPKTPAVPPSENKPPRKIFIAHGKNRKPMESLTKLLQRFGVPHVVAVNAPHGGRPISKKVADLMQECSAGIFIFTKDERFLREDAKGNTEEVWRPSENVVFELGAASVLWEKKIIILREDGVNFPSDFSDLGYITFHASDLASNTESLLAELIALGLLKVSAA